MNLNEDCVIGIVGGMGPQSGLALFNSIICNTKSTSDQQHLSVILMSFPKHIVDRTLFLEGNTDTNPAYNIVNIIRKLEGSGAKIVGMACNTSYSSPIYNVITEQLDRMNSRVKVLHMPLETCRYIRNHHTSVTRVGLMTTNGTYKSGVYKNILTNWGYEVILPDFPFQNNVIHDMIYHPEYGIKANPRNISKETKSLLTRALLFFKSKKAEAIILGCTELSLVLQEGITKGMLVVDSTEALARALIAEAACYGKNQKDMIHSDNTK